MNILSPKDGFVAELFVSEGDSVEKGATLLRLESDAEDKNLAHISNLEKMRIIRATQYSGPELELMRTISKAALDIATEKVYQSQLKYDEIYAQTQIEDALRNSDIIRQYESELKQATSEQKRAEAQKSQLEAAVKRHVDTNKLAEDLALSQKAFYETKKIRLTMLAPFDGQIKNLSTAAGLFSELGNVLMEIV